MKSSLSAMLDILLLAFMMMCIVLLQLDGNKDPLAVNGDTSSKSRHSSSSKNKVTLLICLSVLVCTVVILLCLWVVYSCMLLTEKFSV